jgi:uncharacterized protein (TIGR00251 family)
METIQFKSRDGGVIIPVRAKAAARQSRIAGTHQGQLRISVTAAPEKGKANQAIADLLAKTLGVSKSRITLVAGERSSRKQFLVTGKTAEEVHLALSVVHG